MTRRRKLLFIVPAAIVAIPLFAFIGGEAVKLLWNWLLPPLFGFRALTFWQALGLLALCRILFGGLGRGGGRRSATRRRMRECMPERMEGMTPEERVQFRQRLRERWGLGPPASESKGQ